MIHFLRNGWFVAAIGLAGCASTEVEDRVRLCNAVGLEMFAQGSYQHAGESFAMALELMPNDPDLLYNLGQCRDRQGNVPAAEQYYLLCLQKSADHAAARYALGQLYYRTGRQAQTQKLIEEWFREQPNSAEPYALDGWRLLQERNHPDAMGRLMQALGKDRNNVHALTELGVVYEVMGQPDRAVVMYERSLVRNPNQTEIAEKLAQLRARQPGPPGPE